MDKNLQPSHDVQVDRARSLHRVVRALHDGNCPRCGFLFPSEDAIIEAQLNGIIGEQCPKCGFHITASEAAVAMAQFRPVMEKNLQVFEKWREELNRALSPEP